MLLKTRHYLNYCKSLKKSETHSNTMLRNPYEVEFSRTWLVSDVRKSFPKIKNKTDLKSMLQEIEEDFRNQEKLSNDIQYLHDIFEMGVTFLNDIDVSSSECNDIQCFKTKSLKAMKIHYDVRGYNNFNEIKSKLNDKFTEFVESVSGLDERKSCHRFKIELTEALRSIFTYVDHSHKWFLFLKFLDDKIFAKYEVQKHVKSDDRDTYSNILKYQESLDKRTINYVILDLYNFTMSLRHPDGNSVLDSETGNIFTEHIDFIHTLELNPPKENFFKMIFDETFKYKVSAYCEDNKKEIRGNYVMLSDVYKINECVQADIRIFALKKFYVDCDFHYWALLQQISIIAPIWEIVNNHTITLNYIAEDGKQYGRAGDFLGISKIIINQHLLKIRNAIEGHYETEYFRNLYENEIKCEKEEKSRIDNRTRIDSFCYTEIKAQRGLHQFSRGTCFLEPSICSDYPERYRSGYVIFMISGQQSALQFIDPIATANNFKNQQQKLPKRGCSRKKGMKKRRCVEYQFDRYENLDLKNTNFSFKYLRDNSDYTWYEDYFDIVPSVINGYKRYVTERLSDYDNEQIEELTLTNFLNEISNIQLYNILGFVNELEDLENDSYKLEKKKKTLFYLYQQLLHRIEQYRSHTNYSYIDDRVLSYLIALILKKIRSINNLENDFPRNFIEYLNETIDYINKVIDQNELTARYDYNEHYQKYIIKKIEEANNLIKNNITPEVHSVFPKIELKIESLIRETIKMMQNIQEEKQKLEANKKRLENILVLRYILGFAKIASMFLSFLGPLGTAAGIAIATGTTIAEGIWLDGKSQLGKSKNIILPPGVTNSMKIISNKYIDDQKRFRNQLEDAKEYLNSELDGETDPILKKVTDTMTKTLGDMKKLQDNNNEAAVNQESIDRWRRYKTSMMEVLFQQKDLTQSQKVKDKLTHAQTILSIGEMSLDLYKDIKNNQNQIENIDDAIKIANMKGELLQGYQSIIFNIMIPMTKDLEKNVNETTIVLKGLSLVALDLSAWKIKTALKEAEIMIRKMTEGFEVQDELMYCIDDLRDAVIVMIKMYNNIQIYEEATRFIDYVANINLGKSWVQAIDDEELKCSIKRLENRIQYNVISEKYINSKSVFRHQVFPFADYYLGNYIGLEMSKMRLKINSSPADAVNVIEDLKVYLNRHRTGRNKYRSKMHKNITFGCGSKYIPPFFTWKYAENYLDIQKLLEGKEIVLSSHIEKGLDKNAIKFNTINIRLSLANNTNQDEFDTLLENFEIRMKHHGTSYYRCDDTFFQIKNANTEDISYTFRKNCNEKPELTNAIYDDIASYHPVLSPYAMWSIQLTENSLGSSINQLMRFKNQEMHLLLEGKGEYIDLGIPEVCNENLSKHYIEYSMNPSAINFVHIGKHYTHEMQETVGPRVHRDINKNELVQDTGKSLIATNGGCIKSSFMNNFFNLFGNSLMMFKYWLPVYDASQWLMNQNENSNNEKRCVINTDHNIENIFLDISSSQKSVPDVIICLDDNESPTEENTLNTSLLCNNTNLLLIDTAIRWKNGNKYKQQYRVGSNDFDVEYAQHLAYKAYAHKDD